jgi:hypothetical protein
MRISRQNRGLATASRVAVVALGVCSWACGGGGDPAVKGAPGSGGNSAQGGIGSGGSGNVTSMPPTGYDPATLDPGYVPVHRLTNGEYNNTVADLLGTSLRPADFFQAQSATGFGNNAAPLTGFTAANATAYFDAARELADDVLKNPALKAKVLTCTPAAAGDTACATTIIQTFGRQAWRRPLDATETQQLVTRYSEALTTLGKDHEGAIGHVLRIMLTSAPFLYWIEIDPNLQAAAADKRPVSGYELASRLSYALWGSLPDSALLDLAESGSLTDPAILSAQVDRLLDDPKGPRFLQSFFNQWLHITTLSGHQVDEKLYPAWNEALREAMFADAKEFFSSFVYGARPWTEFLTAPLSPGAAGMAGIYGADPPGLRKGFLGLPAFLTAESVPTRTGPTFRGKVVLDAVMCTVITLPDDLIIPDLNDAGGGAVDPTNIRAKLEEHRKSPVCAGCHAVLDPIGLGLENFDAIGRYRTAYENGDPIDASGILNGQAFNGLDQLIPILTADARYQACPSEKILSYALRRSPRSEDKPYIEQLSADWKSQSARELVKRLVASDAFRFRKLPASAL